MSSRRGYRARLAPLVLGLAAVVAGLPPAVGTTSTAAAPAAGGPPPCGAGQEGRAFCVRKDPDLSIEVSPLVVTFGQPVTVTTSEGLPQCGGDVVHGPVSPVPCWVAFPPPDPANPGATGGIVGSNGFVGAHGGVVRAGGFVPDMTDRGCLQPGGPCTFTLTQPIVAGRRAPFVWPPGAWWTVCLYVNTIVRNSYLGPDTSQQSSCAAVTLSTGDDNSLQLVLGSARIVGDNLDLTLTLTDTGTSPITGITYADRAGVTFSSATVPAGKRGAVDVLEVDRAPPDRLESGESVTVNYSIVGSAVGFVATSASGSGLAKGLVSAGSATGTIEVAEVTPTPEQLSSMIASEFAGVVNGEHVQLANLRSDAAHRLNYATDSARGGTPATPKRKPTSWQVALARAYHYPDDQYAWLPQDPIDALTDAQAFAEGKWQGTKDAAKSFSSTVTVPAAFWTSFFVTGTADQVGAQFDQIVGLTKDTANSVGGALHTAYDFYTSPAKTQAAWNGLPQIGADLGASALAQAKSAYDDIAASDAKLDTLLRTNPGAAARQVGQIEGSVETTLLLNFAQDAVGQAGLTFLSKEANAGRLADLPGAGSAAEDGSAVDAAGSVLSRITSLDQLPPGTALTMEELLHLGGISSGDSEAIQGIIRDLNSKYPGIEIEMQARPVNPLSGELLEQGIGTPKPEPIKAKSVTGDDLLLGADRSAAGKVAVFEPKAPSQSLLDSLAPADANSLTLRYEARLKEWKDYQDPTSSLRGDLDKALQPGGATFDLDHGRKLHLSAATQDANGTIVILDASRNTPFVSDIDFHAVIDAANGGRNLPAGVRGSIELKIMDAFRKQGIPFGQHGWTHSAFDMAATALNAHGDPYTNWLLRAKYLLEFTTPDRARALAPRLAAELSAAFPDKAITAAQLLKGKDLGQYVIKFTAGAITTGPGGL